MIKTCAFCGQEKLLTKEHVWPSCFLKRIDKGHAHYSPKSGKVHGADYIVSDVCQECNNEHLAVLDDYFCTLYDNVLSSPLGPNTSVVLHYDYNLLCRVLLKIAYNTARCAGSDIKPFVRLLPYIVHGGFCPLGVALIAEIVSPSYIEDSTGPIVVVKEIRPTMYRSILGALMTPHGGAVLVRIIAVNSFFFHLLLSHNEEDLNSFDMAKSEFLTKVLGTVALDPNSTEVSLSSSPQDSLSSMLPLLKTHKEQYAEFFRKQEEKYKSRNKKNSQP